ncbi:MAG: hypothetical protein WC196_06965 [Bacilli bacterium]
MGVEIRLRGTAIPCIAQEDIKAGLAVKLGAASNSPRILGGNADPDPALQGGIYNVLQGASLPTSDDDADAKYVAAFRVYNEKPPLYETLPANNESSVAVPYTLREFSEGEENLPADVTLRMVVPRLKEDATIPSGALMLAYDEGIYTVTSGCYFGALSTFTIGAKISVKTGGLWYAGSNAKVGICFEKNTTKGTLTIKTEQ